MHGLTRNTSTAGDLGHRRPVVENLQHSLIALLDHVQLHQHDDGLLQILQGSTHSEEGGRRRNADPECQPATGATVAQEPSGSRPKTVSQLPGPRCPL
jgi:hypothetical protein